MQATYLLTDSQFQTDLASQPWFRSSYANSTQVASETSDLQEKVVPLLGSLFVVFQSFRGFPQGSVREVSKQPVRET